MYKERDRTRLITVALVLFASALILAGPGAGMVLAQGDLFIYPKEGQSEEQQKKDRYECHLWAAEQTGFDPTAPVESSAPQQSSGGHAVRGAGRGAALGAIGGAIGGNAGKGAAIGAAVGGTAGAMRRAGEEQQQAEQQKQQQAAAQQQRAQYNRALSTCLEARDYTVK